MDETESGEVGGIIDGIYGEIDDAVAGTLALNGTGLESDDYTVIDGYRYPDDPFETVEQLKAELANLRQIVSLLKKMD